MVRTAGRYLRRMHARSMHSTSGVCVCCLASNGSLPICTEWWCTEANAATQTHCYNPVAPACLGILWNKRQRRCQEDHVSLPFGRLEKTTRSSPHHVAQQSALSNRIWNNTTLRFPKQQIRLRTALCGKWYRRMALRNLRVACQKRRRVVDDDR